MRQIASLLAAAAVALPGATTAGAHSSPIRPNQAFDGLVNGVTGSATIRMACFGPIMPGQTGHPFAGQTVAVTRSHVGQGFTGSADSIRAKLFTTSATTSSPIRLALFRHYDEPAPISTDLSLPCAGTGSVVFRPVDGGADARRAVVKVYFAGQP